VTGSGEPIIYHGYTLTTKLPFREVIQTIKVGVVDGWSLRGNSGCGLWVELVTIAQFMQVSVPETPSHTHTHPLSHPQIHTSPPPHTHTHTLTQEYAFNTSHYPLIISIENHCSALQQSKMAKIFLAVMGDVLALENLVELEGRERLPSPQELQGKIILKGSFKEEKTHTKVII